MFGILRNWFTLRRGTDVGTHGLDSRAGNPSRNSALHGATEAQSSIEPTDYPAKQRQAQVQVATGRPTTTLRPPD